jgi:hypothetical protein
MDRIELKCIKFIVANNYKPEKRKFQFELKDLRFRKSGS